MVRVNNSQGVRGIYFSKSINAGPANHPPCVIYVTPEFNRRMTTVEFFC